MPSAGGDLSRHGLYFTLERRSYHHPSSRVSPVLGACTGVALMEGITSPPPPGRSGPRSSSVLPSHQEAAAAEDQDHRRDHHHRRGRVDGWRDAKPDHRVYLQRQRARPYARDEERYYEVVERERERQESSGHDAWQDERECYPQEGLDGSRAKVLGRLLDGLIHPGESCPHHDGDERDRERHVRDDYGNDTKLEAGSDKEHEQAYPDDYLRHHGRGVDRRVGEGLAPEAVAC